MNCLLIPWLCYRTDVGVVPANVKCPFLLFSFQCVTEMFSACWCAFILNMAFSVWIRMSWAFLSSFFYLSWYFTAMHLCWKRNTSIMPLVWITPKGMCNSICIGLSICDEFHFEVWIQTCWAHALISFHRNPNEPLQPSTLCSFPPSATSSSGDA